MNKQLYKSTRFDLYALPEGGVAGKDEFPIHEETNHFSVKQNTEMVERREFWELFRIPVITTTEIALNTFGSVSRERLDRVGNNFTLTLLAGNLPAVVSYKVLLTEYELDFTFYDEIVTSYKFIATKVIKGGYDVEVPYARIQYDQGDGTFLEWQKYNKVKIDTILNNRYYRW